MAESETRRNMEKGGMRKMWIWLPIFALIIFWAGIPLAADNAACLNCHKDPKLSKSKKDGSILSLYVNEETFKASVHGVGGLGCTDCHQEAKAAQHPAERFPEAGCGACHQDQNEAYKKTTHGMMRESGMERAPNCADCHAPHSIRKINDPQSQVMGENLSKACEKCHWQSASPSGFFTALSTYRIMGHPKGNLGERYDTQSCVQCHPENTGHPQKPIKATCVRCHDKSLTTPVLMGPIHLKMTFHENPLQFILRILYGLGFVAVVFGIIWYGYRNYQKKKMAQKAVSGGGEEKPPEAGA
jgi:hypothetical protein